MQRMTKLFDMSGQRIWNNECHTVQVYFSMPAWNAEAATTFLGVVQRSLRPVDMLATSALPSASLAVRAISARDAGGRNWQAVEAVAAGRRPEGVAHTLGQIGVAAEASSLLALGTFAELLSFYTLAHTGDGGYGGVALVYAMQRAELVHSGLHRARLAAAAVARVLLEHYLRPKARPNRLAHKDTAFYCAPYMPFVQTAMRRLNLFDTDRSWSVADIEYTKGFAQHLDPSPIRSR